MHAYVYAHDKYFRRIIVRNSLIVAVERATVVKSRTTLDRAWIFPSAGLANNSLVLLR